MNSPGVTFGVPIIRVTELHGAKVGDVTIFGRAVVRQGFSVTMMPNVKTGETKQFVYPGTDRVHSSFKHPDTLQYFEFELKKKWWLRLLPDRDLARTLDHHCAVEMWTANLVEGKPDPTYPWIQWLFPSTSWLRNGRGRWTGRSYGDGPKMKPAGFPDDTMELSDGGFWKTATPPPQPERRLL